MRVLILGAEGMLGSAMVKGLSSFDLLAPSRAEYEAPDSIDQFMLTEGDVVINCIGAIPQKNPTPETMHKINGDFPNLLATRSDLYFIQIATDCVFEGDVGLYSEDFPRDATSEYGRSKKRGEVIGPNWLNLRCSIIGANGRGSLFDWVKNQPEGAVIKGFVNHYWNGVTTDAFASVIKGILTKEYFLAGTQHLVPANWVAKYDLVKLIAQRLGRTDIEVMPTITSMVDRRLATRYTYVNNMLWRNSKFFYPPMIENMVSSMQVE
jgi:dTDP-4-dehydrorhamnose reductase